MINHRSSASDLFLRRRDLPRSLLPKSLFNSTSPNLELAFLVNMIYLFIYFKCLLTSNAELGKTPSRRLHGWREAPWHGPNGGPSFHHCPKHWPLSPSLWGLDPTHTPHVSSGSSALPELIFFMLFFRLGGLSEGSGLDSPFHVKSFKQTKSSAQASPTKEVAGAF